MAKRKGKGKEGAMDGSRTAEMEKQAAPASDDEGQDQSIGAAAAAAAGPGTAEAAAAEQAQEAQRPLDKISAVGHAVWLMSQSSVHKHLFIADTEWLLLPPIAAGQFRLWRKDNIIQPYLAQQTPS